MKQKYLEVAKRMKEYEDVKYDQWRNITEERLPVLLKKTLLARVHSTGVVIQSSPDAPEPVSRILPGDQLSCVSPGREGDHLHQCHLDLKLLLLDESAYVVRKNAKAPYRL